MGKISTLMKIGAGIGAVIGAREALTGKTEESLAGKVAIVTGGSSGLGLEMAKEMARQGARVVICARTEDELERAANEVRSHGTEVLTITCDVANEDACQRLVEQAIDHFGQVDVLVCNAGVIQVGQYRSMDSDDFRQAMDIMFFGTLYPILAVLPHMRERRKGRIGLITSIGGKISVPYLLPYNASKFAAVGLGEGLYAELARDGISVTTIVPGLMRTGSYLNAQFAGEGKPRDMTYRLFSVLSSLPLLTADGKDAAREFVSAIRRGDGYFIYPPQYNVIAKIHGVAPATTMAVMSLVARLMPKTGDAKKNVEGESIDDRMDPDGVWGTMTTLGRQAAGEMQLRPGADQSGEDRTEPFDR
jgi:NAD(P)-dependent dehydrogenase (short-subunit alcohol dehydrogenase family)